ncbi:MAG: hemolysin D [Thermoguttaceae bacterium]|jgi:putative peptide zinc metalloprotease protein
MVTLADSLVSSSARRLSVRARADLSAKRQRYHGRSYWVVKDPVGLNYFRFQDEEYAILKMLDGTRSLDEIKDEFEAEFPPQKITLEELQQFLGMLHRSGLVVANVPGQGRELRKRRDEKRRKEMLGAATNILCIRFKGIDPERLLNWLYPKLRWCFSRTIFALTMVMALTALALVTVEFDVFRSKLPSFHNFFSPTNAIFLAITLALTKVCHEFGHGLACKHFGGECHEMGVMILVLTPCLYCNVSDSWMLPSKWHRAAIGAAGIYVELTLASIATFIWWFTEPGLVHYLCLNVMFISSVSTILFNANPLLRYDGYYILADLVEIPNLRQKATAILSRKMGEWFLGLEPPDDPFLPERNQVFFALYTIAAVIYRWFILASILFFLYKVFEPYGLKVIGQAIAAMAIWGLLFQPIYKLVKFFYVPGRLHKVKKPRMYAALGGLALVVLVIFWVPLPYSIMCTFEVQPRDAASVYVTVPGKLVEIGAKPGERVEKGAVLVRLASPDLAHELVDLEGKRRQYEIQLATLKEQRHENPRASDEIPQVEKALRSIEQQLAERRDDSRRLELRAGTTGIVLPPKWIPRREEPDGRLAGWAGTPLEEVNLGATLERSVPICKIGWLESMEANLVIDQAVIDFVAPGQRVEMKLDNMPHDTLEGVLVDIAPEEMRASPDNLSAKAGGDVATKTDASGRERPLSTSYQAQVLMGLYGHGLNYGVLRGRLEHPEGSGVWRITYLHPESDKDEYGGKFQIHEAQVPWTCGDGDYVEVRGQVGDDRATYVVEQIRKVHEADSMLRPGLKGKAKIHAQPQTLARRALRLINQTFAFKL